MWSAFFSKTATKKTNEDIPAKIESFNQKLTLENMGYVQKKASLQMIVGEKGRGALKHPPALRLISAMKRHHSMMKMYQTSLTALESTQQNLEMQQVANEVQRLIGRAGHANFDNMEDSLETMADMNMERQQLAHLMMAEGDDDDDDTFIEGLDLSYPEPIAEAKAEQSVDTTTMPSPPTYIATQKPTPPDNPGPAPAPMVQELKIF